jgi:sterol 14alpha-demethylase
LNPRTRVEQFRFFSEALKASRLKQYVGQMVQEAEDYFGKWGQEGVVDLAQEFAQVRGRA